MPRKVNIPCTMSGFKSSLTFVRYQFVLVSLSRAINNSNSILHHGTHTQASTQLLDLCLPFIMSSFAIACDPLAGTVPQVEHSLRRTAKLTAFRLKFSRWTDVICAHISRQFFEKSLWLEREREYQCSMSGSRATPDHFLSSFLPLTSNLHGRLMQLCRAFSSIKSWKCMN